jgi:hypothetical protein
MKRSECLDKIARVIYENDGGMSSEEYTYQTGTPRMPFEDIAPEEIKVYRNMALALMAKFGSNLEGLKE